MGAFAGLLLVLALAACGETPADRGQDASTVAPPSSATVTGPPTPSVVASHIAPSLKLPELDRPYNTSEIRDLMGASRRPGGVPDELQNDAVAAQVAEAIWTYRGVPWVTSAAGGSCGPATCTLEVAGTLEGGAGEDLWVFEVADGEATLVTADLRALPADLIDELDAVARALEPDIGRQDLSLGTAVWLLPPQDGRFRLAYRSGGEEGSCRLDVTIDVTDGSLDGVEGADC